MRPAGPGPQSYSRIVQAGLIAAGLLLALLAAAVGLGVWAFQEGRLHPPAFEVKFGRIEHSAPCPARLDCEDKQRYYAIWRGDQQPDGTIRYRLVYFTYLNRPGRR